MLPEQLIYKHTGIQAYRHTGIQAYRHTGIQAYRHTGIQAYKHTGIRAYRHAIMWSSHILCSFGGHFPHGLVLRLDMTDKADKAKRLDCLLWYLGIGAMRACPNVRS